MWQRPNAPLVGWLALTVVGFFLADNHLVALLAKSFIIAWALLELVSGVSYFRRILGAIVLAWAIIGMFG